MLRLLVQRIFTDFKNVVKFANFLRILMPEVNELLICAGNRSSDFVWPNAQASF